MFRLVLVLWIFLGFSFGLKAQKESSWWYYVQNAGIQFTSVTPAADTHQNEMSTGYFIGPKGYGASSVASIASPKTGELFFYGSAIGVFNKNHQPMPNGIPLDDFSYFNFPNSVGHSAEEGSIIIPRPNNPTQYYFFYLRTANNLYADGNLSGLIANLIDMELDGGLGDVVDTFKNVYIIDSTEEKISATPHANGIDYWLMVRQGGTNNYHAFLITENGISAVPVTTSIGLASSSYGTQEGSLRFNHQGNMLANLRGGDLLEIFDFDNSTGVVSNLREIQNALAGSGMEFSPDDSKLYGGGPVQYDLSVPTQTAIAASETLIAQIGSTQMAGLQLGLDGKIYGNTFDGNYSYYMDVIHNPNALGAACNHQDSAIYLMGKTGGISVPQFLPSFFRTNFYADTVCAGDTAGFYMNFTFIDSVFWNFGDPPSGANNTDTAISPSHVYANPGTYTVTLIAQNGVKTDTVIKTITVKAKPKIDLGADQEYCKNNQDSVRLSAGGLEGVYAWSTGSTDSALWVSSSGIYALTFTDECGADTDAVQLFISLPLTVNLPPDTMVCADTLMLSPEVLVSNVFTKYIWKSGETTSALLAQRQQSKQHTIVYSVTATNACGSASDSMVVTFLTQPDGFLPNDSVYCSDIPFYVLNPQTNGVSYRWQDGTGGPQYRIDSSQTVSLLSFSACDTLNDTFNVEFVPLPYTDLGRDTAICLDDEFVLYPTPNRTGQDLHFGWNDGSTDSILLVTDTGLYSVIVTLKGCVVRDSILIFQRGDCYNGCKPRLANIITPNADGVNDEFASFLDCPLEAYQLQIFNRWGQVVFASNEPSFRWDGSVNGNFASEGTYFYSLRFTPRATNKEVEYRGSVLVVR